LNFPKAGRVSWCASDPVKAGRMTKQNAQIKRTIKDPIV